MAVRPGPGDLQRRAGIDQGRALQHRLDRIRCRGRQHRQVRQGFLADLAVGLAERAAQQPRLILADLPGLRRVPAPHPVYVHPACRVPAHEAIISPRQQSRGRNKEYPVEISEPLSLVLLALAGLATGALQ